jgi:hypothetical protein
MISPNSGAEFAENTTVKLLLEKNRVLPNK